MFDQHIARRRGKRAARLYHRQTGEYEFERDTLYRIAQNNGWSVALNTSWHVYVGAALMEIDSIAIRDGVQPVYGAIERKR